MKTPRHKTIPSTGLIFRSTSRLMSPASGREIQTEVGGTSKRLPVTLGNCNYAEKVILRPMHAHVLIGTGILAQLPCISSTSNACSWLPWGIHHPITNSYCVNVTHLCS